MMKVTAVLKSVSTGPKRTDTTTHTIQLENGEVREYIGTRAGQHWVAPKRVKA